MSNYLSVPRLLFCVALLAVCTFGARGKCARSKPIPFPQGVADPAGSIGYVANGAAGVEAIDLLTGKELWTSDEASRPLLVAGNRLVAGSVERNTLRISVLDTKQQGKVLFQSNVSFPDWVVIGPANNNSFSMDVGVKRIGGACVVVIDWHAQSQYKGGAPPPEWVEQRESKRASGVVHIDLYSGKVENVDRPRTTHGHAVVRSLSNQSSWRFEQDAREAFAIGSRVYYLVDRSAEPEAGQTALRARDLSSGKLLWETTLQQNVKLPRLRP